MVRYLVTIKYTFRVPSNVSITHLAIKDTIFSVEINYLLEVGRPVGNLLLVNIDQISCLEQVYIINKYLLNLETTERERKTIEEERKKVQGKKKKGWDGGWEGRIEGRKKEGRVYCTF